MSIADKLLYLNDTKTALADAINIALSARGEAPLDVNATFRSYAERLFYPGYLFGQGEQGGYYLPPNAESYFTDTAGTTPAALTDAIALVQGEVGPDWTQGTATARPIWAREPEGGRRNLLTTTFGDSRAFFSGWSTSNSPVLTPVQLDGEPATKMSLADGATAGRVYLFSQNVNEVWSFEAKAAERNAVIISRNNQTSSPLYGAINLETGAVFFGDSTGEFVSVEDKGNGWYRISIGLNPSTQSVQIAITYLASTGGADLINGNPPGNGVEGIYIRRPQYEVRSSFSGPRLPSAYQRDLGVANLTEAGVPDVPYVRFDLADDVLTTTLPAGTYTVVLPTRQGIWIDSVAHAGGTFSIGPTSYTGGPDGILAALESDGVAKMIAPPLVIDRVLSAGERNGLVQWYQARGAGELLEVLT